MVENIEKVEEKKKTSMASTLGNIGIEIGSKLGKVATEFFTGKQPTKEEKESIAKKKERQRLLKDVQEEAQFKRDLELAKRGQYVPPQPKEVKKTKKEGNMFSNLGKYNPIEGFEGGKKLPDMNVGGLGSGNSHKTPNFGLEGFTGSVNPINSKTISRKEK